MTRIEPHVRRWTRDEYYQMAALGWFEGKRALLLQGEIIEMPRQGNWHSVTIGLVHHALLDIMLRGQFWIRILSPLDLPDGESEPEPDLAVVPGKPDDYTQHPSTAMLIVEVSDTSLRLDRRKVHAYASAAVPEYWIVNLQDHWVEVCREPVPDATADFGYRYANIATLRPGEFISPLAAPQARVAVSDLLPAQPVGQSF